MIIELGHYALVMAFLLSLVQAAVPLAGAARGRQAWMLVGSQAATSFFWLVLIAFLALLHAFALSDLSVRVVAENSHTMKPLVYKLSALWAHHEGSMLLWLLMLAFWSALLAENGKKLPPAFKARALSVMGMVSAGFAAFILWTSNPFNRLDPPAPEGLDLNPLLQDPLLAIHPPMLYAGYVGFAIAFSFAVAALIEGKVDRAFAAALKPWALAAWFFLTIGIGLGSFWAYYELGWGGFWFWDPVENASLLPWLAGLALLHSLAVLEKRDALRNWTIFLALLSFSLSLLGTFLVRSGVLTSVHAFASDPTRGIFILALMAAASGGAFLLYGFRATAMQSGSGFGISSRESAILFNNVFLFAFAASVFMGTLYPLFMSALDLGSVSVGGPYYVAVVMPLLLPFAVLMGLAPRLIWKENIQKGFIKKNTLPLFATISLLIGISFMPQEKSAVLLVGMAAVAWIFFATFNDFMLKTGYFRSWRTMPMSYYGMIAAHLGFAVFVAGCVLATQLAEEKIMWMKAGDQANIGGSNAVLLAYESGLGQNYNADRAIFSIRSAYDHSQYAFMAPEKRWYPAAEKETSEAALLLQCFDILYIVLGDTDENDLNRRVIRMYYHPYVTFVYLGALLMALGALLAMADRKRVRE